MSSSKIENNTKNIKSQFLQIKIDNYENKDKNIKKNNLSTQDIIKKNFQKI